MAAHEVRRLALGAEAQILELQHVDHGIVVVGLEEIDVVRRDAGHAVEFAAVHCPAAAILDRIVGVGVVPFDGAENPPEAQAEAARLRLAHDQIGLGAGTGHDAVEQMHRLGDRPGVHIPVEGERRLEQGVGVGEGVFALGDAHLAEILPPRAVGPHVIVGQEGETGVRSPGADRVDGVLAELAEILQALAETVDMVGVAGDAGDDIGIAGLDRARRPAHRDHAGDATHRDIIEPARRQPVVLDDADRGIRRQRHAGRAHAVEPVLAKAGIPDQRGQGAADPPMGAPGREADIGDRDRSRDDDAVIGRPAGHGAVMAGPSHPNRA